MKENGLITAYLLDGKGGGRRLDWAGVRLPPEIKPGEFLWFHMDYSQPDVQRWLREESGLEEAIAETLLQEEIRPRVAVARDALLLVARGVNLHPESDPEDMVAIRMFVEERRIVSTQRRPLLPVEDLCRAIDKGEGPETVSAFIADLNGRLVERIADVVETLDDQLDALQNEIMELSRYDIGLHRQISFLRLQFIRLRRYLSPQREALTRLHSERLSWLDEIERLRIRETADRTIHYVEDLDTARERATVAQEELFNLLSEQLNRRSYILSLIAVIFLPLSFLTGLLGINVGGIPGAESNLAFWIFTGVLIVLGILQVLWFKSKRWM
ncbi:zinc transporter ZntB [Nitrospina gracilis]|uniref:zinc transporter ZntB n=1 Tax=Nitrospina gracilis TaxID=35801 RepID=UPI001F2FCAF1|nr:zinc transporter ZntB [Nitrospina gracilis]MCF8720901.1 zinc transporter [Nitrospina gracilis Nb-211]